MMFVMNAWTGILCWIMGVHELASGSVPVTIAYTGFGIGYMGLAWLYLGGS